MSATLYLLRQQPDHISSALFRASDVDIDIVFIEQAIPKASASSFVGGILVTDEKSAIGSSGEVLTYDDLVEKIFSSEHVIVL
jgi:hypothetical protein